jgi:hypothetical protein
MPPPSSGLRAPAEASIGLRAATLFVPLLVDGRKSTGVAPSDGTRTS